MTADIIQMPEPLEKIGARIDAAYTRTQHGRDEWIEGSLALAAILVEARNRFLSNGAFSAWLGENNHDHVGKNDRAALINFGGNLKAARICFQETTRFSYQLLWEDVKSWFPVPSDRKTAPEPVSIPEPPILPDGEAQIEQTARVEVRSEPKIPAPPSAVTYPLPATSKLRDLLGAKIADVLLAKFKNSRMFIRRLGDHPSPNDRSKLKYLAERCVKPDYPIELFRSEGWSLQLMYPHLPQRLLDMLRVTTLSTLHSHHATLAETERRFVLTPEFGMIDPPMAAFNKANEIFNAIVNAKNGNGNTIDPSAIHRPVYKGDEGKPPVIIRGIQLWPAEEGAGYGYDDLRCAFEFAKDILLTFEEPRDAPMTTKSLKLRHLMSWLPGGYNSTGSTIDGLLKALRGVVQAYSSNKSDVMRAPLPSMKKLDET